MIYPLKSHIAFLFSYTIVVFLGPFEAVHKLPRAAFRVSTKKKAMQSMELMMTLNHQAFSNWKVWNCVQSISMYIECTCNQHEWLVGCVYDAH